MTIRQSDNLHKVQTALVSLCTLLVTGCFAFLWNMNAEMATFREKAKEYDRNIETRDAQIKLNTTTLNNHETRLSILESQHKPHDK